MIMTSPHTISSGEEAHLSYLVSISHELFANVARISPGYNMQLLGCLPTAESTLYEGPITLSETTVVKAIAFFICLRLYCFLEVCR